MAAFSSSLIGTHEMDKYEVFISFRGADVRRGFLSHLYPALKDKQIHAFIDSELVRGTDITGNLFRIIEHSDLSIVIFSKDYPKSEWCLEELEKIHDLVKQRKQIAVPIFYEVDPSDVQDLKGNYAIHLQKWRDALVEISNLSGFDSRIYSTDAELIEHIVDKVSAILSEICPRISHNEGLFGIDPSVNDVEELLNFDSIIDVRMVGIWGMGGIGKTTIASKVFRINKKKFKGYCFVPNVRETLSTRDGLISLRLKIIHELLGDKDIKIDSSYLLDNSIQRRIKRTKFLLVLDDVLTCTELKSVLEACGLYSQDSFCLGSRIIVTSRDSQVLRDVKLMSYTYEAKELRDTEARHLLCWHAFGQNIPQQGYETLVEKVVQYTHGVPLALVVLGCEIKQKSTRHWEDALKKFDTICPCEIQKILRISFDGLDWDEKNIFLDIACFLKGKERNYVVNVLEACGFHARVGINRLIDKSLLKEEKERGGVVITMHDLLEQMGKEIVAKEKQSNGHQSRLWTSNDIRDALTNDWGAKNVEAISYEYFDDEIAINPKSFSHMCKLRFLSMQCKWHLWLKCPMDLEFLPKSIKYLHWDMFSQRYWPSNYNLQKLVELHLPYSKLKEIIWSKPLISLKSISLYKSKKLIKISDLAMAPNLEDVDLSHCYSLVEVGSSLVKMNKLVKLDLTDCRSFSHLPELPSSIKEMKLSGSGLRKLPSTVGGLIQLEKLSLNSCYNLENIPGSISRLISLEVLDLYNCSSLVEIGSSLENLKKLTQLDVRGCDSLSLLPDLPGSIVELHLSRSGLKQLPSTIGCLPHLKELSLNLCRKLESLPKTICNLTSLETLDLSNCKNLRNLPEDFEKLKSLKELHAKESGLTELPSISNLNKLIQLDVSNCRILSHLPKVPSSIKAMKLRQLPSTVGVLITQLKILSLSSCRELEILPSSISSLTSLEVLNLSDCSSLVEIGSSLASFKKLTGLDVRGCESLALLPELPSSIVELRLERSGLKQLPSVLTPLNGCLSLSSCYKLESLPSSICTLTSLEVLDLSECGNLHKLPEDFGNLKYLMVLNARKSGLAELPSTIGRLTRLKKLELASCEKLESLPSGICDLTSLETLELSGCINLRNLPEYIGNLKSLTRLNAMASGLTELSLSIQNLKELIELDLTDCKELQSLPALPSNLLRFYANSCISVFSEVKSSIVEQFRLKVHRAPTKYNDCRVDGKQVPEWMKYRNNCGSTISLDFQTARHSTSFIFCVVVLSNSASSGSSFISSVAMSIDEKPRAYKFQGPTMSQRRHERASIELLLWNHVIRCKFVKQVSFQLRNLCLRVSKSHKIIGCGVHPSLCFDNAYSVI